MSEIETADPETVVGRLALYASPDIDVAAWYPCGVLDASETYGFVAPTFAFDGNDLLVIYAVSAPDGCDVRGRTHANFLAFRRFANFRTQYEMKKPDKANRTRVYMIGGKTIFKYYRTEDGEWQPDGVLVNNADDIKVAGGNGTKYALADPAKVVVRGKRVFVLSVAAPARFFEFDLSGTLVGSWLDPSLSVAVSPTGWDVSADGSYALLASSGSTDKSVWRVRLSDNHWEKVVEANNTTLTNPRDVALLPAGDFFVTDYNYGDGRVVSHYAADGSLIEVTPAMANYYTGVTASSAGTDVYVASLYGYVWHVPVASLSAYEILRQKFGSDNLGQGYLCSGLGQLYVGVRPGFVWVRDLTTGVESSPLVQLDANTGIAIYEYVRPGLLLLFR